MKKLKLQFNKNSDFYNVKKRLKSDSMPAACKTQR